MRILTCLKPGEFAYSNGHVPEIKKGYALIKVQRIGICGTDLHAFEGTQPFFNYPRVLGHELAGEIVEIETHADYRIGDQVSIIPYFSCGTCFACTQGKTNCCSTLNVFGVHSDGGMAEFILIPIQALFKSASLDLDALALLEPLSIGAHGIKRSQIKPHEFVLIVGAGPIGLMAAKVVRHVGARFVVISDINESRLELARSMGVDIAVNPMTSSIAATQKTLGMKEGFDVALEMSGAPSALPDILDNLSHGGRIAVLGLPSKEISINWAKLVTHMITIKGIYGREMYETWYAMNSLIQTGLDIRDVITDRFPANDWDKAFAAARSSNSGKVIMDWS